MTRGRPPEHQPTTPMGLRLRGEIDGVERTFPLPPTTVVVGGGRDSEVRLPARGVSRRHAQLESIGPGVLRVVDLGSKNGTFVDEEPVDQAEARAGQQLRFGSVDLVLEAIPVADTRLGLDLGPLPTPRSANVGPSRDETSLLAEGSTGLSSALLEQALATVLVREPDLGRFLAVWVGGWGLEGAALLEQSGGTDSWGVAASAGSVGDLPPLGLPPLKDLSPTPDGPPKVRQHETEEGLRTLVVEGTLDVEEPVAAGRLAVVLWQRTTPDAPVERPSVTIWLPSLWRLCRHFRPRALGALPTDGAPAERARGLDFPPGIVAGETPVMKTLYRQLQALAAGDLPVLIAGETGVGKEHIARTLHRSSPRCEGPFIAVNCAALPAELLEAELFGIGRGVATGVSPRRGRFLEAAGGTIFLDEIGEMAPALQAKLLRVLQEKEIHPLGLPPRPTDARVVSATNADLHQLVEGGTFRRDLYYRLAGDVLEVPPLRQRRDDIPRLVGHFLRQATSEQRRPLRGMTVKALQLLERHPWPGNVRELAHEIQRLVSRALEGQVLDSEMLSPALLRSVHKAAEAANGDVVASDGDLGDDLDLGRRLERLERALVEQALRRTAGNQSRAARLLGISRNGLANRLARLGLEAQAFHGDQP